MDGTYDCTLDDENYRLNYCTNIDRQLCSDDVEKSNFMDIHSENSDTLKTAINRLEQIWEFRYANGRMRKNIVIS